MLRRLADAVGTHYPAGILRLPTKRVPRTKGRTAMAGPAESTTSVFRRWPHWLRRGGITPDGNLYCPSWGLNCASFELDAFMAGGLPAAGPKSKFHDPELTELAGKINGVFREAARRKKGRMLGILLLDEGACLTWETPRADLDRKSD